MLPIVTAAGRAGASITLALSILPLIASVTSFFVPTSGSELSTDRFDTSYFDLSSTALILSYQQDQQVFDELAKRFIQHSGTTLLDMTMGSATSLIAGLRTGLCSKIIGVDYDKSAVTIAKKRIADELSHRLDSTDNK